jgi:hypothetical protein
LPDEIGARVICWDIDLPEGKIDIFEFAVVFALKAQTPFTGSPTQVGRMATFDICIVVIAKNRRAFCDTGQGVDMSG